MTRRSTTKTDLSARFGKEPFTVAQAAEAGVSPKRTHAAAARGDLRSLARGCYVVARGDEERHVHLDRARTALLSHPHAVLAGVTAAAVWDLPCPDTWGNWANLPLTVASERRLQLRGATVLALGERTHAEHAGLPVTDLVTTAADVAWQLPLPNALIVIDAVAARLLKGTDRGLRAAGTPGVRQQLITALDAPRRRPGIRRMRTTLSAADPSADSPPESYFRGHLLVAGVPEPIVNAPVVGASGKGYYVDLYWPKARLAVEIDGAVKYTDLEVLRAEKRREDDLRAMGFGFKRLEAKDVYAHAPLLVAEVWESLRLRAAA